MPDVITLDMDTPSVQYLCEKCKRMKKIIQTIGPITYVPHGADAYAHLIYNIIGQMLSNNVADVISDRMVNLCDGKIAPERVALLSDDQIKGIGLSTAKTGYIRDITTKVISGDLNLSKFSVMKDQEIIDELTSIKGIGNWTAKMYLIFVLDRQDILPYEDGAFLQAYRWAYKTDDLSPLAIQKKCKKWSPYSSIAARYLYRALDSGLTKKEFHLFK
ncbi:DNA-3-methyladenine glycosylase family protein [Enterocloster clostridioformis]|uniref:DNA-3-methyladenine glycosylase family protein n=1 Tax=Enterocloster clostridioformis TaxID=1531 RepID=UPI0004803831|nr:DNA-3-methyladenine glycosylase [Enterocloster clostridioformis]